MRFPIFVNGLRSYNHTRNIDEAWLVVTRVLSDCDVIFSQQQQPPPEMDFKKVDFAV